jgi:hypothetical protein
MRAGIMMDGKPAEIYVEEREEKRENEAGASRLARRKPAKTLFLVSHSLQVHSPPCIVGKNSLINPDLMLRKSILTKKDAITQHK